MRLVGSFNLATFSLALWREGRTFLARGQVCKEQAGKQHWPPSHVPDAVYVALEAKAYLNAEAARC